MFVEVAGDLGIAGIVHAGYDATRRELEGFGLALPE